MIVVLSARTGIAGLMTHVDARYRKGSHFPSCLLDYALVRIFRILVASLGRLIAFGQASNCLPSGRRIEEADPQQGRTPSAAKTLASPSLSWASPVNLAPSAKALEVMQAIERPRWAASPSRGDSPGRTTILVAGGSGASINLRLSSVWGIFKDCADLQDLLRTHRKDLRRA